MFRASIVVCLADSDSDLVWCCAEARPNVNDVSTDALVKRWQDSFSNSGASHLRTNIACFEQGGTVQSGGMTAIPRRQYAALNAKIENFLQ